MVRDLITLPLRVAAFTARVGVHVAAERRLRQPAAAGSPS